ncbi:glycoside hydrolase family 9 protein [Pleomorphovibrio marinus]|uniref:glycoside hydrolase family 9 protein n=1 Tax=Pleomorphovibrio marinus TaxID=2164132 RepID=UPI000E09EC72|nr:glycoside hydrolase family 9 protein [Pleomorphovibrio marinus]
MKGVLISCLVFLGFCFNAFAQEDVFIRVNQLGYLPDDHKTGLVFSKKPFRERIELLEVSSGKSVKTLKPLKRDTQTWGVFDYYYELDFTDIGSEGTYKLVAKKSGLQSTEFKIGSEVFGNHQETLLEFMRQQRCGYNPTLDLVCHAKDGRNHYGPVPDSTYFDLSGGWHDAGDQLQYLITTSYATAHMLLAYELYPDRFDDKVNALGQTGPNGIPDILDEAKWGLDWIHKMHPREDILFHQIADDRDHKGFKELDNDPSDYGWGPDSYRAAYISTGEPQGLGKYKSEATGVSNLAGRSAAAMAIAARIWEEHLQDPGYAHQCKEAAISLYALGREKEGFQQGNSFGAPYRYNEETYADDMEWGAAELYKLTGEEKYLEQAKAYAALSSNDDSWMVRDSAAHYQLYPFINIGHFALHQVADEDFKKKLENYYLEGIEYTLNRAKSNPFHIGIPFIWCSNNLLTSLIAQIILYEKMTGDMQFQPYLAAQRDWLFGRNPWGTSMFTGIPDGGEYPVEVHTSVFVVYGLKVPGGLVDGPIYRTIHDNLLGLTLHQEDKFAQVQNHHVAYHDDVGDYSTNEPTMDGTAGAILMMAHFGFPIK